MRNASQQTVEAVLISLVVVLLICIILNRRRDATPDSDKDAGGLGVKDLVAKVKSELIELETQRRSSNQAALLELKDFDLEIKFLVSTARTMSGKLNYSVMAVGGESKMTSEKVHSIRLHMVVPARSEGQARASEQPLDMAGREVVSQPPP